jgi:hypothetical protein
LAVSIVLNELADNDLRRAIEREVLDVIGDRPGEEMWKVWIYALQTSFRVVVQGPSQTREQFFFEAAPELPGKVRDWLSCYPFR